MNDKQFNKQQEIKRKTLQLLEIILSVLPHINTYTHGL